jgi:hypothetical protein
MIHADHLLPVFAVAAGLLKVGKCYVEPAAQPTDLEGSWNLRPMEEYFGTIMVLQLILD